ncbi:hypothetical protein [Fibrella aquatica]|uniref:hypothetical protein n=1 Tax=Fibrella aquatica TaxID=3242487 RepID=UPI00352182B6
MTPDFTRRSFLMGSATLLGTALLDSCIGTTTELIAPADIVAWGDSLTQGEGGTPYPTQLATLLSGRTVKNFGITGQIAQQIAARQGGLPVTITVQGNSFAGTSQVPITTISTQLISTPANGQVYTINGTVAGVPCVMTRSTTGNPPNRVEIYTIAPVTASTASVPAGTQFIPDEAVTNKSAVQLLWMGRNDTRLAGVVDPLIQASVNYLTAPRKALVIGVLSGRNETATTTEGRTISSFNSMLATTYGDNYVVATPPTDAEMMAIGYTPTDADKASIAAGTWPYDMYSDSVHLKTAGYQIIANRVAAKLKAKNW